MESKNLFNLSYSKIKYITCIFTLVLLLMGTYINANASTYEDKIDDFKANYTEILILTSNSEGLDLEATMIKELMSSLTKYNENIRIHNEFISYSNFDKSYLDKQIELMSIKYSETKFDLIIPTDDEALDFIGKYYENTLFFNTPIVYCGIKDSSKISRYPFNLFTGVLESINPRPLIDLILKLNPKIDTINVLLDNTIASRTIEQDIRSSLPYYSSVLKINFIKSTFIEDITYKLSKSSSNSASIVVGNFYDSSNVRLTPKDTMTILNSYSPLGVYTLNPSYIGNGVIGGYSPSAKIHSNLAYEIAIRILKGDSTHTIPPIFDTENFFVFDLAEVVDYDINRKLLPENTLYINDNWFNRDVSSIIVIMLIFIIVVCILLLIAFAIEKSKSSKKAIIAEKKYGEALVNDKIKTEFIANFSHEIRTLLNVILSGLQLLDMYKSNGRIVFMNEEDSNKLIYIRRNGFRLLKLINNLIDMTKIDSGFYNIEFETKNIVDVIEDITMSIVEYAKNKGITIIFDTTEEEIYMPLDSEKLDRIILNLLSNAIKFTPKGGYVYVNIDSKDDTVFISVRDTGIGISEKDQQNIFDRFAQASNSTDNKTSGSGIGLSLVKSLVELFDGKITLKSELNKGSEFLIELPIKDFDKATSDIKEHMSKNLSNNSEKFMIEFSDIDI